MNSWIFALRLVVISCVALLCACGTGGSGEGVVERVGQLVHACPIASSGKGDEPASGAAASVLGWRDGTLMLFGAEDGEVWAHGPWVGAGVVDMALDRDGSRVWVVNEDESGEGSELLSVGFRPTLHGPSAGSVGQHVDVFDVPQSRAWIDGRARVLPVQEGLLLFEEGYGERWRLFSSEVGFAPSVPAWRPASVWSRADVLGTTVHALAHGSLPAFHEMHAWLDESLLSEPNVQPLGLAPATWPSSARLQPGAGGSTILADIDGGKIVVSRRGGDGELSSLRLPIEAERIEQLAVTVEHRADEEEGAWERVVLLLSGPPAVVVVDVRVAEKSDTLEHEWAHAGLGARTVVQDRFFGRFLVLGGNWLLVATTMGVEKFAIRRETSQLRLIPSLRFEGAGLAGPVVAVR